MSSLTVNNYYDKNTLEPVPLQQLVHKSFSCEHLELYALYGLAESNALWVETAGEICSTSQCLKRLIVKETRTTAEDGAKFLQTLADSELVSLEEIDLSEDKYGTRSNWFGGKPQPVETFIVFLDR